MDGNILDQGNTPITVEQALENGATLEKLGITKETEKEINSIDKMLENEDIENNELMKLAPRINSLQFDIIKEKLAKTLNVDKDDISLYTETADEGKTAESVSIKNGETYRNQSFLKNSNTITSDISSFIKDIGKMQTLMNKIQTNDINRNGIIKKYKSFMDSATKFAAAEMNIDEKGNISMDYTKVSELQEQTANKLHSTVVEKTEGQTKNASCTITIKEMDKER